MTPLPPKPGVPTQRALVRSVAYKLTVSEDGQRAEVSKLIDQVLTKDLEEHDGQVFHEGQTPRASARRALYDVLPEDTLIVKDGHGYVRFKLDALRDVIIHGDAWQVLPLIPEGVLSCIIADAPTDHLDEMRDPKRYTTQRMVTSQHFQTRNLDQRAVSEFYRILQPGGYLCLYVPPMQRSAKARRIRRDIPAFCDLAGFVDIREVVWKKSRGTGSGWTGTTEPVWCYVKPLANGRFPPVRDRGATNYIEAPTPARCKDRATYQDGLEPRHLNTDKPLAVARHLLRVASIPGGILGDFFAGTASASMVAAEFGMAFLAVELDARTVHHMILPPTRLGNRVRAVIELAKEA